MGKYSYFDGINFLKVMLSSTYFTMSTEKALNGRNNRDGHILENVGNEAC